MKEYGPKTSWRELDLPVFWSLLEESFQVLCWQNGSKHIDKLPQTIEGICDHLKLDLTEVLAWLETTANRLQDRCLDDLLDRENFQTHEKQWLILDLTTKSAMEDSEITQSLSLCDHEYHQLENTLHEFAIICRGRDLNQSVSAALYLISRGMGQVYFSKSLHTTVNTKLDTLPGWELILKASQESKDRILASGKG